jgi:hypothetical protein
MAGALGLLTGMGLGAAAGFTREQVQKRHQHDAALFDFYSKNPQLVADSPEAQGFIKKYAGKDASTAFITMANHVKQASQMFGSQLGGGGAQPTAGGAPAASGQPSTPDDIKAHIQKIEQFMASPDAQYLSPEQRQIGLAHLADLRKQAGTQEQQAFKEKEFQQTQTRLDQQHADTEADKAAQRQMQAQNHADSIMMQKQFHGFMEQMASEKNDEAKQVHFENASKNLSSQTEAIAKMLSGASPADPATVKTLLEQRNAQARQLKAQAEANGIDYDPDEFKPLTTRQVPGWLKSHIGIGGSTTEVTEDTSKAAAPTAVTEGTVIEGPKGDRLVYKGGKWTPSGGPAGAAASGGGL